MGKNSAARAVGSVAIALSAMLVGVHAKADADTAGQIRVDPPRLKEIGRVDEWFLSYNVETVEVTGGNFWAPYAAGTKSQITGYLTASYGGLKNFGVIYGVMAALMALASGVGPMLGGVLYDRFGNYDAFLILETAGCIFGGLIMISLPNYPDWGRKG